MKTGPKPTSLEAGWQKLLKEVERQPDGCWLLKGRAPVGIGYRLITAGGKRWYAHVFAHYMMYGPSAEGAVHRHTCDRPNCVNPDHIIPGTHQDNIEDKVTKRRHSFGEKHYRSKLTSADAEFIRQSKLNTAELSRMFGISRGGILNIKTGRSWKIG